MSIYAGMHIKFNNDLQKCIIPHIEGIHKNLSGEFGEVLKNTLFDLEGPRYIDQETSSEENHFYKIFKGFYEIEETTNFLSDVVVYIRRFPSNLNEIPKTRFFQYHIGNYFNEIYILYERLISFKNIVLRAYKTDSRFINNKEKSKVYNLTFEKILESFLRLIKTRGRHVHEKRYMDDDLDRLGLLPMVFNDENRIYGDLAYKQQIKDFRKKWVKIITGNNKEIEGILDQYYYFLHEIIFNEDGNIIF